MKRPVMFLIFVAFLAASAGELSRMLDAPGQASLLADSCAHYQARAQGKPRTAPLEFVVLLAESCSAAEQLMRDGTPVQRGASALLLSKIGELHETVSAMNVERARAARLASVGYSGDIASAIDLPVSPAGEFLIAHRMGVMVAIDAWLDTGVEFPLAYYR